MKSNGNYFRIKNSIKTLFFGTLLILLAVSSCSKDEEEPQSPLVKNGGPFELSELAGSWEATAAQFFRVTDGMWVDVVYEGGSLSLTVESNGKCTFIVNPVDREAYTYNGEMFWSSYEGDVVLAVVWDGNPNERSSFNSFELTNTSLHLGCGTECGEYDYNNNGTFDIADLNFDFIRN